MSIGSTISHTLFMSIFQVFGPSRSPLLSSQNLGRTNTKEDKVTHVHLLSGVVLYVIG
jgi:hypothetical protein